MASVVVAKGNRRKLSFGAETTFGTAATGNYQFVRFTDYNFNKKIESVASAMVNGTRRKGAMIQTAIEADGSLDFELTYDNGNELLESVFFDTWSTAKSQSGTDVSAASGDNSFNASVTDLSTNVTVGDWVWFGGFTATANNKPWKVVTVTATKIVVSGGTVTTESAGNTITMKGSSISDGTTCKSFTFEEEQADLTKFRSWTGMVAGTMSLEIAQGGIISSNMSFLGKDELAIVGATIGGTRVAAPTNQSFNAISNIGDLQEGGADLTDNIIKISLSLENNLKGLKAIGSTGNFTVAEGDVNVSGSIEVFFENETLYNKFVADTQSSLSFSVTDALGNSYLFDIGALDYTEGTISGTEERMVTLSLTGSENGNNNILTMHKKPA